ncbi:MAG: hypothetical protein DRQ54_04680, partial [Gammaproteobacteria bacterium]
HVQDDGGVPKSVKPHWLQPGKNGFNFFPQVNKVFTQVQCEINISEGGDYHQNGTVAVGDVDNDGDLEMVGVGGVTPFSFMSTLWIANAADCSRELNESQAVVDGGGISSGSHPGLLDIDGDGDLEIIAVRGRFPAAEGGNFDHAHLMAIHHDGTLAWPGNGASADSIVLDTGDPGQGWRYSGPTFADIDGDGSVEIIMATRISVIGGFQRVITVFNSIDGSLKWEYRGQIMASGTQFLPPTVVDLDMDGSMEIIISADVVSHLGTLEFRLPFESPQPGDPRYTTFLYTAVANFDNDPYPEIVARDTYNRYLFNHDGSLVWQISAPNRAVGQITVADFDGDNEVEFAYVTTQESGFGGFPGYITMYDNDGSVLWTHKDIPELHLNSTFRTNRSPNPTAFDANGDGAADIVIHYDNGNPPDDAGIYFFNGRDGSIQEYIGFDSYHTSQWFLTIADTDNDGEAELISSFSSGLTGSTTIWQGTPAHPLPPAPAHHNQWVSNEAYADAKGNVLSNPTPHWLQPGLNGWNMIKMPPHPLAGTVDSFTYIANDAVLSSNIATVAFDVQPAGTPPVFLSEPDTLTTVGFPYDYAPHVVDIDTGDSVSFLLTAGPAGMSINPGNGKVSFVPDAEGSYAVTILASDTIGFSTLQSYTLTVGLPVTVPDVVGQAEAAAESMISGANLLIGDKQSLNHPTVPAGAVSSQTPVSGSVAEFGAAVDLILSLGPAPDDVDNDSDGYTENEGDCNDGDDTIFPGANDPSSDGIDQDCDGIDGNLTLASILVLPVTNTILTGEVINLTATGIFEDGTSQNLTEIVNWSSGPAFSSATAGVFPVTASRNAVSGSVSITVVDRVVGDIAPPVAEITTPAANSTVTEPVDIIGTATDANFLKYTIGIAPAGEANFTEIANSTTQVNDGVLGQLDPTMLINDLYTIRLTVFDTGGNQVIAETTVQVDENMKVGNFSLTFTDLLIPMSGVPITVNRVYDSRDKRTGDFGVGWSLDVQTLILRANRVLGTGWQVVKSGYSFSLQAQDAHKVSLRLPGGKVEEFDMLVTPTSSNFTPFPPFANRASFQARPGTVGKLQSLDNNNLSVFGAQPGEVFLVDDITNIDYDPQRFKYTSVDGTEIIINKSSGIEMITEPNGGTLEFRMDGIFHSAGKQALFVRDDLGRITTMTDPNGKDQHYSYDANGDLVAHADQEMNSTKFTYNRHHGLLNIIDPLGRVVARNEYDANGRLISSTNSDGRIITYDHDLSNRQEIVRDSNNEITVVEYDNRGNAVKVTDPLGGVTTNTYDSNGNPLSMTNAEGETITRTFDSRNNQLTEENALGETITFTYNNLDKVTSVVDALGHTTTFDYDSRGNRISKTDAMGNSQSSNYDSSGNVLVQKNTLGNTVQFEYDSFGHRVAGTDSRGNRQTFSYDNNGYLTGRVNRLGFASSDTLNGLGAITSSTDALANSSGYTYNSIGVLETITDAAGNVIRKETDVEGKELASIDALGNRTERAYDNKGNLTEIKDELGRVSTLQYDTLDRLKVAVSADGNSIQNTFDKVSRIISQTDQRGNVTLYEYDDAGRRTKVTDALGNVTSHEYDAAGRQIKRTDAKGNVFGFTYDNLNRKTRTTFPDGSFELTVYDSEGHVISETDAMGNTNLLEYDVNGNLTLITDALGGQTSFIYDKENNRIAQTDANGNQTSFQYDANNRLIKKTYPDGGTESQTYDQVGNVDSRTDANGNTTTFDFDANNQLIKKTYSDNKQVIYSYVSTGTIDTLVDSRGLTSYRYDSLDRMLEVVNPDSSSIAYIYDAAGNIITTTSKISAIASASVVSNSYDALNRVKTVMDNDGNISTYSYDANGNLGQIAYPNNTRSVYQYDSLNRLTQIEHLSGVTVVEQIEYSYNAIGDRLGVEYLDGSQVVYEYDALRRLTREIQFDSSAVKILDDSYSYDPVGNRLVKTDNINSTARTSNYDSADKLLSSGSTSFAYDANGNLIYKIEVAKTTQYGYDLDDRLITVDDGAMTSFEYDGLNNKVRRTTSSSVVNYLVDNNNNTGHAQVIEEFDSANSSAVKYVYGIDLINQDRAGQHSYYHVDGIRSTRLLTNSSGVVTDRYGYDAFGELINSNGSTENSYLYTGEQFDPNSGFYYLRARYYAPQQGRFVSRDPFQGVNSNPLSLHKYLYANANPVTFSDPSGMFSIVEFSIASTTLGTIQKSYNKMLFNILKSSAKIANSYITVGAKSRQVVLDSFAQGVGGAGLMYILNDANTLISNGFKLISSSISKEILNFAVSLLPQLEVKFKKAPSLKWNLTSMVGGNTVGCISAEIDSRITGQPAAPCVSISSFIPQIEGFDHLSKSLVAGVKITESGLSGGKSGALESAKDEFFSEGFAAISNLGG